MFSDHLPKIDQTAARNLMVIAGALVMVCQVVAMVMVADGQVKKAEARESQMQSQRLVVAQCLETVRGAALSGCTDRGYSDNRLRTTNSSQADDGIQDRGRSAIDGLMAMPFAAR